MYGENLAPVTQVAQIFQYEATDAAGALGGTHDSDGTRIQ
jgi:hypothetical protein